MGRKEFSGVDHGIAAVEGEQHLLGNVAEHELDAAGYALDPNEVVVPGEVI